MKYIVQLFIDNGNKIVRDACLEALLSMCESTRVCECLKVDFPSRVSLEAEGRPEEVGEGVPGGSNTSLRWAEILLYLMRKGSSHIHEGFNAVCSRTTQTMKNLFATLVVLFFKQV